MKLNFKFQIEIFNEKNGPLNLCISTTEVAIFVGIDCKNPWIAAGFRNECSLVNNLPNDWQSVIASAVFSLAPIVVATERLFDTQETWNATSRANYFMESPAGLEPK